LFPWSRLLGCCYQGAPGGLLANLVLVLLGAVLPLWVMLQTHYTITATGLRIVSGPFRWNIPLHEIRSVAPTRNPLSSPALSLDRLRIEYESGKWIMVSPRDKENFLRELRARGSMVRIAGHPFHADRPRHFVMHVQP
jgi:hypothetical protein